MAFKFPWDWCDQEGSCLPCRSRAGFPLSELVKKEREIEKRIQSEESFLDKHRRWGETLAHFFTVRRRRFS